MSKEEDNSRDIRKDVLAERVSIDENPESLPEMGGEEKPEQAKDLERRLESLEQAALSGDTSAQFALACIFANHIFRIRP